MEKLLFEDKVKTNQAAFIAKVKEVSAKLKIYPNWLMAVMNWESAGTFSPAIQNPSTRATGLIQFMPKTAKDLGTTVEALRKLSNVQQLDWVYKYYKDYTGKLNSYPDLYFVTFFPAALGKSDSYVLQTQKTSAGTIARLNPSFDLIKDQKITAGELRRAVIGKVPESLQALLVWPEQKKSESYS